MSANGPERTDQMASHCLVETTNRPNTEQSRAGSVPEEKEDGGMKKERERLW